jgi:hypothetical protein
LPESVEEPQKLVREEQRKIDYLRQQREVLKTLRISQYRFIHPGAVAVSTVEAPGIGKLQGQKELFRSHC